MADIISSSEIIERAQALGYKITNKQLADWHRAELLPQPTRQYNGRGSVSLYPKAAATYAIAIAELLKHHRSLDWVGWTLWNKGFEVPERYWRAPLKEAFERLRSPAVAINKLVDSDDDGEFDDASRTLFQSNDAPTVFKHIRKNVGQNSFGWFLLMAMSLVRGQFIGLAINDNLDDPERREAANILDRGMGLVRARTDYIEGGEPWLTGDVSDVLHELAPALTSLRDSAFFVQLNPNDIIEAREELFHLRSIILENHARNVRAFSDRNAFGLQLLTMILSRKNLQWEAGFLAVWLTARTHEPLKNDTRTWIERQFRLIEAPTHEPATAPKAIRKTRKNFPFPDRRFIK